MAYFRSASVAVATTAIALSGATAALATPPAKSSAGGNSAPAQSNAGGNGNGQANGHSQPATSRPAAPTTRSSGGGGSHASGGSTKSHTSSGHSSTSTSGRSTTRISQGASRPSPQSGPDTGSQTPGSLNTDCTSHKDPRDPGSCQEKGKGNTYDRDPYRGPNRGNDCDEGGGNNIKGIAVTNPHNADSPDDTDRGQGNNRCVTRSSTNPPGGNENPPGGNENPPGGNTGTTPGGNSGTAPSTTPAGTNPVAGEQITAPAQPASGVAGETNNSNQSPGTPGRRPTETVAATTSGPGVAAPEAVRSEQAKQLPFTGLQVLWVALIGLALCGLSGLLRAKMRTSQD